MKIAMDHSKAWEFLLVQSPCCHIVQCPTDLRGGGSAVDAFCVQLFCGSFLGTLQAMPLWPLKHQEVCPVVLIAVGLFPLSISAGRLKQRKLPQTFTLKSGINTPKLHSQCLYEVKKCARVYKSLPRLQLFKEKAISCCYLCNIYVCNFWRH